MKQNRCWWLGCRKVLTTIQVKARGGRQFCLHNNCDEKWSKAHENPQARLPVIGYHARRVLADTRVLPVPHRQSP